MTTGSPSAITARRADAQAYSRLVRACIAASLVFVLGCGRVGFTPSDSGETRDASMDAALDDAPMFDAATLTSDAWAPDASTIDAAMPPDAGTDAPATPDAGPSCGTLRLYYGFEEASGVVRDESGCGNHGTPNAVAAGTVGRVGSAYTFNRVGVSDAHVLVPDSPSLSALAQISVEVWVRHVGGNFQAIVTQGNLMDGDAFILHTYSSRDPAVSLGNHPSCAGVASFRSLVTSPIDSWVHVAFTYDATTGLLIHYVDGVEVRRESTLYGSSTLCDDTEPMLVGAGRPDGTWGWQGSIDELRIWSVIRSQTEICEDAGGVAGGGGVCALP